MPEQTSDKKQTVKGFIRMALSRRRDGADLDTIHERVSELARRKVPRVTVQTQLVRHRDTFRRLHRGVYALRVPRKAA